MVARKFSIPCSSSIRHKNLDETSQESEDHLTAFYGADHVTLDDALILLHLAFPPLYTKEHERISKSLSSSPFNAIPSYDAVPWIVNAALSRCLFALNLATNTSFLLSSPGQVPPCAQNHTNMMT